MEHPARVEEERERGTGPRGRDRGGERPPGVAVWVADGIIRVVLGVAKNIPNFYPDFIGERRTLMQLGEILTLTLSLP